MSKEDVRPALPWWRVRMVWLVIGGPALVVLACAATVVLALAGADTPLPEARASAAPSADTLTPAQQARNHAVAARR
ncbi:MAG TPA: hypothetical protein VFZ93_09595 [Albitalea sp.]